MVLTLRSKIAVLGKTISLSFVTREFILNEIFLIGDTTVGKSALIQVLKGSGYPKNYVMVSDGYW